MSRTTFPFTAVVGQDDAKLALTLLAIDPRIGGVLLRGDKGSAKTTLARGLADLLADDAPFVDLPLGATEDRLVGSIDLGRALASNDVAFSPGLLADVDGGVLYVDEVNLLADHLIDTLLDVSVSGVNRVEREGVSHQHDSRFVLVGSMNPEEGELRPQLLDRFGLSVTVSASNDPAERAEAVRRRLDFDQQIDGEGLERSSETESLRMALAEAKPAVVSDDLIAQASRLAVAVGAEGLRADIVLCRAAAAHAGLQGRAEATADDLRVVAPLVLAHRSRRNPFDPPVVPPQDLSNAIDESLDHPEQPEQSEPEQSEPEQPEPEQPEPEQSDGPAPDAGDTSAPMASGPDRQPPTGNVKPSHPSASAVAGRRVMAEAVRGRHVRDVGADAGTNRPIAVASTVRRVAERRNSQPHAGVSADDLRYSVRERKAGSLLILVVDTSGSMGADSRASLATGTAFGLLRDAYERRDHVALITFGGDEANVILTPTSSVEVARNRLSGLESGGQTPLAAGLRTALNLSRAQADDERSPFVILISDGRASGSGGVDEAVEAAGELRRAGVAGLVLDCETGLPRLGLAERIADALGSPCLSATDLEPAVAAAAIRQVIDG